MQAFASDLLEPLVAHDTKRGSDLIATLGAYLRGGGALAQAADTLGVHRNTLSYRLGRIEDLTGRDLADPRTQFLFQIALDARTLLHALAD
jgi:purine catabolism regulator